MQKKVTIKSPNTSYFCCLSFKRVGFLKDCLQTRVLWITKYMALQNKINTCTWCQLVHNTKNHYSTILKQFFSFEALRLLYFCTVPNTPWRLKSWWSNSKSFTWCSQWRRHITKSTWFNFHPIAQSSWRGSLLAKPEQPAHSKIYWTQASAAQSTQKQKPQNKPKQRQN